MTKDMRSPTLKFRLGPFLCAHEAPQSPLTRPVSGSIVIPCTHLLKLYTLITPLVAQLVRNLPAMQETWVLSLGWEDPLEKGKATHSSVLACRIPWTEEPGGLQSMGLQRAGCC